MKIYGNGMPGRFDLLEVGMGHFPLAQFGNVLGALPFPRDGPGGTFTLQFRCWPNATQGLKHTDEEKVLMAFMEHFQIQGNIAFAVIQEVRTEKGMR